MVGRELVYHLKDSAPRKIIPSEKLKNRNVS